VNVIEIFYCKMSVTLWHIDPLLDSGPHAAVEVLLEALFSVWSAPRLITQRTDFSSVSAVELRVDSRGTVASQ
jgi:hypothetical protein